MECPECHFPIQVDDVDLNALVARCRRCQTTFQFAEPITPAAGTGAAVSPPLPAPRPEGLRVQDGEGRQQIVQRWFGYPILGLLVFCIAWDSFLIFWYSMAIANPAAPWIMIVFPIGHVAVGVGLTYTVLAGFFNRTVVTVADNSVRVWHGPIPWRGNRSVDASQIAQLYCDESSTALKNNTRQTTFCVNAVLADGTKVVLLTGLQKDQALFYEQQLEEWLDIDPYPVKGEWNQGNLATGKR